MVLFGKARAWMDAEDTPADTGFDHCWLDWVRLENAGYEEAKEEEDAYDADENPFLVQIQDTEKCSCRNLLETEYALLHR